MNARRGLPLTLIVLVLSACMVAATAQAQDAGSAAAAQNAGEEARSDPQEEEEGFWGGIVSSFVDFFAGDSEEAETGEDLEEDGEGSAAEDLDGAPDAGPEDARKTEQAAAKAGDASIRLPPRRNLRPAETAVGEVTPDHVYRATADLVSEIRILRNALNVDDPPGKTPGREHRAPAHVYAKSLEVMEKTARFQKRLGMIPVQVGDMVSPVSQSDLHRGVQTVIEELRRVKRQLVVGDEIDPAPLVGGKTSTLIYDNLAHASLLLDGLVGRPTSANDLYRRMLRVHGEMLPVAAALEVTLNLEPPAVDGGKETVAVAQQVVRAANRIVKLQTRLGMDAFRPPRPAREDVTTAEVFDATNFLLAEMARIKAHLDIELADGGPRDARDKTTADVFARVLLVIRNLDIMNRAVDGAG